MASWNPWHGCHKLSAGCVNCYVYRIDARHEKDASVVYKTQYFDMPIKKNRKGEYKIKSGETVYTCFTSDFFLEDADEWRKDCWKYIKERSDLNFLIVTKRIDRFMQSVPKDWGDGYDNVCICCTVENQDRAEYRLPIFKSAPIKHKCIVCEPLLENVDLSQYLDDTIEQVVVGGESGNEARFCKYEWVLNIREQCIKANVDFWFKQTGAKFIKDKVLYRVKKKDQGKSARRANINFIASEGRL